MYECHTKSNGAARVDTWAALKWHVNKSDAEKLVNKLETNMRDLSLSLILINMYVPHINAMNEADEDYHREVTAEIRNVGLETMRSVERLERAMLDQRAEDMARNIAGRMQPIIPSQRAQIKTRRQLVWFALGLIIPSGEYACLSFS